MAGSKKGYGTIHIARDFDEQDQNGRRVIIDEGAYQWVNNKKYVPPKWLQESIKKHTKGL